MGLAGTLLTKVGIPIGIMAAAGILLYTFRDQIVGGIKGGSQVLGQAISEPIGGILTGFNEGLKSIPSTIDIKVPSFQFAFAEGADPAQSAPNVGIGNPNFDFQQALVNLCRNSGGLLCLQEAQKGVINPGNATPNIPNPIPTIPEVQGDKLTLRSGSIPVSTSVGLRRLDINEIIKQFPGTIGLFDDPRTKATEFLPLTQDAISFYKKAGIDLRLSGQIFNEISNFSGIQA